MGQLVDARLPPITQMQHAMASGGIVSPATIVAAPRGVGPGPSTRLAGIHGGQGHTKVRATKSEAPPLVHVLPEFLTDGAGPACAVIVLFIWLTSSRRTGTQSSEGSV